MDCENLDSLSGVGGVSDWAFSARSIRGFADRLEAAGHLATLFLCPETAVAHRGWLRDLESRGHELAMHFHPVSFSDGRARGLGQLGQYVGKVQREMLTEGLAVWADALGKKPATFRPGCLSANDETFQILVDLGFTQGSVSSPGRNEPVLSAIWQPPLLDAHLASAAQRSLSGDLDFVEIPLSVDWEVRFPHRFGWDLPQELMIERGDTQTLTGIISKHVKRFAEQKKQVPTICAATHNVWDFSDAEEEKTQILLSLLESMERLQQSEDVRFIGATIASIADQYRRSHTDVTDP